MPKLRNVSGNDLAVFYPPGNSNSVRVPAGESLEVTGEVTHLPDAYQLGQGDDARLYPHALWALEDEQQTSFRRTTRKLTEEDA